VSDVVVVFDHQKTLGGGGGLGGHERRQQYTLPIRHDRRMSFLPSSARRTSRRVWRTPLHDNRVIKGFATLADLAPMLMSSTTKAPQLSWRLPCERL
jgi:hypothetical protein